MSLALEIAVDWLGKYLSVSVVALVKDTVIEKGIKPSWSEDGSEIHWVNNLRNWNQVCNGGMVTASLVIAEENPRLAAKTITRVLIKMLTICELLKPNHILKTTKPC